MVVALQAVVLGVEAQGAWRVITKNAGVTAMHAAVTPNVGSVVILDHTNTGPSNITFPGWWMDLRSLLLDVVVSHSHTFTCTTLSLLVSGSDVGYFGRNEATKMRSMSRNSFKIMITKDSQNCLNCKKLLKQ